MNLGDARPDAARPVSPPATESEVPITPIPEIPDHELLKVIGRGSYGEVWLARNVLGEFRAVKVVYRIRFEHDRPYEREFEGIQKFEPISRLHESQVDILHVGRNDQAGYFYYVMELADDAAKPQCEDGRLKMEDSKAPGRTPRHPPSSILDAQSYTAHTLKLDLYQRTRLPVGECIQIGLALTTALEDLHSHGLVHRDVKPSNIIFIGGVPKLADIGLVASMDATMSFVGTSGFLPPEGPGTPQGDIYSLGKVLYEISMGRDRQEFPKLPPEVFSENEKAAPQAGSKSLPHSEFRTPHLHRLLELNEVILKACQSDPHKRYQSAKEMHTDLELLQHGQSVQEKRKREQRDQLVRRAAAWAAIGSVVLGLILLVSRFLLPSVAPPVEKRSTNDVANRFYDLGRFYYEKTTAEGFQTAATYFQQSIEADPQFAQAHAALALTYTWAVDKWNENWTFLAKAKEEAVEALKLDPSLAEPHLTSGWYKAIVEWAWNDAELEYQHALNRNPYSYECHLCYADFLRVRGRTNEALKQMILAFDKNPRSISVNGRMVDVLLAARKFPEAITQADQAIAMEPNAPKVEYAFRIRALCALGRYGEAIDTDRKFRLLSGESPEKVDTWIRQLQEVFASEGTKGYYRMKLEAAEKAGSSSFWLSRIYAQMGETEKAIACLQDALKNRDVFLTLYVMTDWTLDPVRSDPRFHAILRAMNLE